MRQANIRQKGNSYEARIMIGGKRYSVCAKTVTEVKKKVQALQKEVENGNVIARNIRLNIAMKSYLYDIKQFKVKGTTFDRVESIFLNHIQDENIGRLFIGTITPQDIQKLLADKCKEGLSLSSIKKIYNLLGEFFRYATVTKAISNNPMTIVEMPHSSNFKHQPKEMEVLMLDEMREVISVAERTDEEDNPVYRYGEGIILLFNTGIRSGELRGLHIDAINLEKRELYIYRNATYSKDRVHGGIQHEIGEVKTRMSRRVVPLNDRAVLSVQRLLKTTYNPETGYLLCTSTGKIVTHSNLQKCYTTILKKAGIRHMGLHSTRHTFATILLKEAESKGQIKEVSEMLGHADTSITYKFYIKTSNEDKKNLINQLNTLVS